MFNKLYKERKFFKLLKIHNGRLFLDNSLILTEHKYSLFHAKIESLVCPKEILLSI